MKHSLSVTTSVDHAEHMLRKLYSCLNVEYDGRYCSYRSVRSALITSPASVFDQDVVLVGDSWAEGTVD